MLILEGSDCLGKSTFAKLLLEEADKRQMYPTFYSHMSRPNEVFNFFGHYKDMMTTYAVQDRFHIGGVVWHEAIHQSRMSIIEGWLRSIGSMTFIFYASDLVWYRKRIEEDNRGNLLSIEAMIQANIDYNAIANNRHEVKCIVDRSVDIKKTDMLEPRYLDSYIAKLTIDSWFESLGVLERSKVL